MNFQTVYYRAQRLWTLIIALSSLGWAIFFLRREGSTLNPFGLNSVAFRRWSQKLGILPRGVYALWKIYL
jgi:hypothetical protein